jgi:dephospho-CoA kinase
MKLIGITGGIATGKSVAGRLLLERDYALVDTDDLARAVVAPGEPALLEIVNAFGKGIVDQNGALDRVRLAQIVFSDPVARQRLELIVHPPIRACWKAMVEKWRGEGRPAAFVSIPLLYETDAAAEFDSVVCLACSADTQRQRMRDRGWTLEHVRQRLSAQWPLEEKVTLANYVLWSDTTIEVHSAQLDCILRSITE